MLYSYWAHPVSLRPVTFSYYGTKLILFIFLLFIDTTNNISIDAIYVNIIYVYRLQII